MPKVSKPKLVNRGPAGLLTKHKAATSVDQPKIDGKKPINRISTDIKRVVTIDSLVPDPNNARVHPDRNLEAIAASLDLYGQIKPIVVRRGNNVVIAGNGTLECAKRLGWTKIGIVYADLNDVEAAGYGMADNRTAELARWDFEVVARLDKLLQEANHTPVGWTLDELEVLRQADWTPPAVQEGGPGGSSDEESGSLVIGFNPDQYETIAKALIKVREVQGDKAELEDADALVLICKDWLGETNA